MDKKTKPNYELLSIIPNEIKKIAIWNQYRLSLIVDPKTAMDFFEANVLTESEDDFEDDFKDNLLKSILSTFPDDLKENVKQVESALVLSDTTYFSAGSITLCKDELNQDWILFHTLVPVAMEIEENEESLKSLINERNSRNYLGSWVYLEDEETKEKTVGVASGFSILRSRWGLEADRYASNLMAQLLATAVNDLDINAERSKIVLSQRMRSIAYGESEPKDNLDIISKSILSYREKLKDELKTVLAITTLEGGYMLQVPLSSQVKYTCATIYILEKDDEIFGPGMFLGVRLPGVYEDSFASKIAYKLNFDDNDQSKKIIHTTPKLAGAWYSSKTDDESGNSTIGYSSYIPFSEPGNYNRFEHIEGIVKEAVSSWAKVDLENRFNSIVQVEARKKNNIGLRDDNNNTVPKEDEN